MINMRFLEHIVLFLKSQYFKIQFTYSYFFIFKIKIKTERRFLTAQIQKNSIVFMCTSYFNFLIIKTRLLNKYKLCKNTNLKLPFCLINISAYKKYYNSIAYNIIIFVSIKKVVNFINLLVLFFLIC